MYTDTPIDLSRLRSTFSTSPLRTDTDRPTPSDTSTPASLAPSDFAKASAFSTSSWKRSGEYAKPELAAGGATGSAMLTGGPGDRGAAIIPSTPHPIPSESLHDASVTSFRRRRARERRVDRGAPQQDPAQEGLARAAGPGRSAGRDAGRPARRPRHGRAAARCDPPVQGHALARGPAAQDAVHRQADAPRRR